MTHIKTIIILNIISLSAWANFLLPPDIAQGISRSTIGESGGFGIREVEEKRFSEYIRQHWREIAENIESLPMADPGPGRSYTSEKDAFNASAANFGAACEVLPPMEYLDFLEKWLDLYQQEKISDWTLQRQLMGLSQKDNFLDVNWEHPRVKNIATRTKELIPDFQYADSILNGTLADGYLNSKSDDDPLPETLPGIKLKRPWGSVLKKYERMTGKKSPHDPHFDPRPTTRIKGKPSSESGIQDPSESLSFWQWLIGSVVVLISIFGVLRSRLNHGKRARSF